MSRTLTIAQPQVSLEEPHNCTDVKDIQGILSALFDPLVAYDEQMNFVPGLAAAWTVSEDARTWTFSLQPNAAFHDGSPVDADAVAYSLKRMARPDMGVTLGAPGVYNQYLGGMEVTAADRHTVRILLASPMADLLDVLVSGYILPPDAVETAGELFKTEPVGTGPYRFADHREDAFVRAEKNTDYFGPQPAFDSIVWRMIPDPAQRISMAHRGEADIAVNPPGIADRDSSVNYVHSRGTTTYILIFNADSEAMADSRVRTAINLGIDRTALINHVLDGAGYPLTGFISPAHFGYDGGQAGFVYNPELARELLAEAGFTNGLQLTLDSPTSMPNEAVRLSEALAEQLLNIGIHVNIVYTEDRELYANKVRKKEIHDLCVFDSSPLSTYRVLKEKIDSRFKGSWWQGYANTKVETLLDRAQVETNINHREDIYKQCFRLLNEDPPWLYLYNYKHVTYAGSAVSGWKPPLHGVIDPRYF